MSERSTKEIAVGAWVKLRGLIPGEETVLHFVPEGQTDYFKHRLPPSSLLGQAMIGAKAGDAVRLDTISYLPIARTQHHVRRSFRTGY